MKRLGILLLVVSLVSTMLMGCRIGNTEIVIDTNVVGRNSVFSINGEDCTKEEAKLYLCNYQNIYGYEYGINLWEQKFVDLAPEDTLESYVKNVTLYELATIMCMSQLAAEQDVRLSTEEQSLVDDAADEYFSSLTEEEKDYMSIDKGELKRFYKKYATAKKLYDLLTQGVNEEVSDDEARVMRIQQIFVSSAEKAKTVEKKLEKGDFASVASVYNEEKEIETEVVRGKYETKIEKVLYSMEDGAYSGKIKSEKGYYFFKCLDKYDEELTEANKDNIIAKRRKEQFDDVFAKFLSESEFDLNETLWAEIKVDSSGAIKTDSFFEVYDKYFQDKGE